MKRFTVLFFTVVLFFSLTACKSYDSNDINYARRSGYTEGYKNGYDDGYSDAEAEFSSDYDSREAFNMAENFVRESCEYSAEEAYMIVSDYLHGTNYYSSPPTEQEFYNAVDSLGMFFMYFY